MGIIIRANNFFLHNQFGVVKPIVYCCQYEDISERAVSINKELARTLIAYKPKRRTMQIEKCFADIVNRFPDIVVIKDFDVLFNPDYKIDVLKMMIEICKIKSFSIIWPGKFEHNRLIYAEIGFLDYKTYDVNDYDITCIV